MFRQKPGLTQPSKDRLGLLFVTERSEIGNHVLDGLIVGQGNVRHGPHLRGSRILTRWECEIAIPREGVGDSHALAAGIAGVLALFGCRCRASTAATGGYDAATGLFTPVPSATLGAKLAAAERWGIRRIMIVDGQAFDGVPGFSPAALDDPPRSWRGIELRTLPADPAALIDLVRGA